MHPHRVNVPKGPLSHLDYEQVTMIRECVMSRAYDDGVPLYRPEPKLVYVRQPKSYEQKRKNRERSRKRYRGANGVTHGRILARDAIAKLKLHIGTWLTSSEWKEPRRIRDTDGILLQFNDSGHFNKSLPADVEVCAAPDPKAWMGRVCPSKLDEDKALDIVMRLRRHESHERIANLYGVTRNAIAKIAHGHSWSRVTGIVPGGSV